MSVSVDAALAGEIFDHFCNAGTLKSILRSYRLHPLRSFHTKRFLSWNVVRDTCESPPTHMSQKKREEGFSIL